MDIRLARVDSRLIHGQVATVWTKETGVKRLIVVNDEVAKDKVRSTLLKQVAPPGVSAHVVGVDKAVRVYNNPKYAKDPIMFLYTNPTDVVRMIDQGVPIKSVNIGSIAYTEGKTMITSAVAVGKDDIEAFHKLHDLGVELELRKVPSDNKADIMPLLKKLGSQ
ncbi:MAG: mannose/fructose/sorbose PTS transporter subunit IIB [Sporolactobacillus sp.]|jgi:PTS system mannose-specific IIB component|nr:mannose/fructose/sorbose PTS transporter subunit IIB [Sporolactobacillus sp.]MCI1882562.1 mannose/fructose/sorbose PTS transporter subunit IIB [Sporolactobacillus sp.]